MPAQVQVSLWRRTKTQQPPPAIVCPHWPRLAPGAGRVKVGANVLCLVPCQSTGASCQQLLSVPSPEAREAATGFWMGQMAGDRLGGTAEQGKVGSGHLALLLASQLFLTHGS